MTFPVERWMKIYLDARKDCVYLIEIRSEWIAGKPPRKVGVTSYSCIKMAEIKKDKWYRSPYGKPIVRRRYCVGCRWYKSKVEQERLRPRRRLTEILEYLPPSWKTWAESLVEARKPRPEEEK